MVVESYYSVSSSDSELEERPVAMAKSRSRGVDMARSRSKVEMAKSRSKAEMPRSLSRVEMAKSRSRVEMAKKSSRVEMAKSRSRVEMAKSRSSHISEGRFGLIPKRQNSESVNSETDSEAVSKQHSEASYRNSKSQESSVSERKERSKDEMSEKKKNEEGLVTAASGTSLGFWDEVVRDVKTVAAAETQSVMSFVSWVRGNDNKKDGKEEEESVDEFMLDLEYHATALKSGKGESFNSSSEERGKHGFSVHSADASKSSASSQEEDIQYREKAPHAESGISEDETRSADTTSTENTSRFDESEEGNSLNRSTSTEVKDLLSKKGIVLTKTESSVEPHDDADGEPDEHVNDLSSSGAQAKGAEPEQDVNEPRAETEATATSEADERLAEAANQQDQPKSTDPGDANETATEAANQQPSDATKEKSGKKKGKKKGWFGKFKGKSKAE